MGSRYFFIMMYVWLEKSFSREDYRRAPTDGAVPVSEPPRSSAISYRGAE